MSVNVAEFIDFCSQINIRSYNNNTYIISPEKLNQLKQKSEDKHLYLGVIGEFSSGKSTLINAILHQNLLKKATNPTTSTPTFIQYGEQFNIIIDYSNGRRVNFWNECNDSDLSSLRDSRAPTEIVDKNGTIRAFIEKYTANEDVSRSLDRVTIYLNNEFLKNGLVIVDTPGINAGGYERHEEVTKETIKKYCDAAIIITRADNPSSQVTCNFINKYLSGLEDKCIGIMSQIDAFGDSDSLDEDDDIGDIVKEQDEQLADATKRFNNYLNRPLTDILPVSAKFAEGKPNKYLDNPKLLERYKKMFSNFMEAIHERLVKGRERILAQKIKESVIESINALQKTLEERDKSLREKQQKLENNRLTNVDYFRDNLINGYNDQIRILDSQVNLQSIIDHARDYTVNNLVQDLNLCETYEQLENVTNRKLSVRCNKAQDNAIKELKSIQKQFARWSNEACEDFQRKFAAEFRNLSRDIQFAPAEINVLSSISSDVQNLNISHDGEFLAKGAGYIISGILGGPLGVGLFALFNLFFWNIDSARRDAAEKIDPILDDFINQLCYLVDNSYKEMFNEYYNATINHIYWIVERYRPNINQIINDEMNQQTRLQAQRNAISRDLEQLRRYEQDCKGY